jgi:ABC-type phosphate/phosphonate transport system substrate-binding protein
MERARRSHCSRGISGPLLLCLGLLAGRMPACAQPPVVLAVPAGEQGLARLRQWRPLADYLADSSGLTVSLEILEDHRAVLAALEANLCDLAFVDPVWCAVLIRRGLGRPLARPQIGARDTVRSVLIVHRDSIIRRPQDLAGRTVALTGSGESGVGYFLPLHLLRHSGGAEPLEPLLVYSDTDLSVLKGVAYGKLEAGFLSSAVLDEADNAELADQVRVVMESDPIPQWTVVLREGLRGSTTAMLRKELLGADRLETGQRALKTAGVAAFVEAREEEYFGLLQLLEGEERALAASE